MPTEPMRYRVGITWFVVEPVKGRPNFHRVAMGKGVTSVRMDLTSDELVQLYEQLGDYITQPDDATRCRYCGSAGHFPTTTKENQ